MTRENGDIYRSWAQEALSYTINRLSLGRSNTISDWSPGKALSMIWGMSVLRMYSQIGDDIKLVQCRANVAKGVRVGNCQEHAAVSFDYLAKMGRRPIAIMCAPNHAFTIVGYDHHCNFNDPLSFPDWSWVCDAWKRQVYQTNSLMGYSYYDPVIQLRTNEGYPNYLEQ